MWLDTPLHYVEPFYRPPAVAGSFLLQLTVGCSHNHCTFCAMYRNKRYLVRPLPDLCEEIRLAAQYFQRYSAPPRKVFIGDGDALAAPTTALLTTLEALNSYFPRLRRVSIYATVRNILNKSEDELRRLAAHKLTLAYVGMESGSDRVLELVAKRNSSYEIIEALERLRSCGWQSSVIAMTGLGGYALSEEHAMETARVISATAPEFFSLLTTVIVPGTPYQQAAAQGKIQPLTAQQLMKEMQSTIVHIRPVKRRIIFRANHVSNVLPLEGILPRDTQRLVQQLESWIEQCPVDLYPDQDPRYL